MQIDKQRALQGELARTLEALDPVEQGEVLLNIAPGDVVSRRGHALHGQRRAACSSRGSCSARRRCRACGMLVSRAVPRLSEDDVSVVDGAATR